ncbi:MAG TPA: c-type cytochrome, partial [Pirellulaceae bacterium]|nr:c-type cytochrome [Pirellulaceae bacterium]
MFLDDIPFPNGVKAWRGGVLVTAAPQVFYAEDHDGDDKADKRVTLFEGFVEGNQQHRTNGLRWGLDNWLYMANGDSGGTVKSFATGKNVSISGRDLRLRPDTGELDTQAGQTQFGRNRTDWGDWFGGNNANPMWHYVLEDHYLRRNPHVAPPENRKHVSVQPGASPVFPTSKTLARFNDFNMSNRFTSACSPEVYRDDWKWGGPPGAMHVFICEPVHNLVHHEVMTADGATFTSRRADDEQQSEFFTSSDNWCRPVMVRTGPDGALWIADMYRAVIEHPEWIPLASQRKLDLRAGSNMGRIYRVVPAASAVADGASKSGGSESGGGGAARAAVLAPPARAIPKLDQADVAGLVAALDSPNGWQRDTAQQLLVERFGPAPAQLIASAFKSGAKQDDAARRQVIELLTRLARDSRRPVARLHALCTLDGINGLSTDLVVAALADAHPGVRRHAARLAEPLLAKTLLGNPTSSNDAAASAALGDALTRLIDDSDATVRIQTAYSLGAWEVRGGPALARLAIKHQTDPYLVAAVLSSVNAANLRSVLTTVFAEAPGNPPARLVDPLLATATGLNDVKILDETLAAIAKPVPGADAASPYADWQLTAFGGLLDVLERRKMSLATLVSPATSKQLDALLEQARATASNTEATEARRIAAVRLVGRSTSKSSDDPKATANTTASESATRDVETLVALLSPRNSTELQAAAVQSLARFRSPAVANRLLEGWKSHSPNLRAQILDALLSRDEGAQTLMTALKDGRVPPAQIDARRRQQLLAHRLTDVRQAAEKAFASASEPSRQKVLETFAAAATLPGDVGRGKATFTKKCAVCHRLEGQGHLVGPDIASIGNKSPEALLVAMLDPNRAIEDRYLDYSLLTIDG